MTPPTDRVPTRNAMIYGTGQLGAQIFRDNDARAVCVCADFRPQIESQAFGEHREVRLARRKSRSPSLRLQRADRGDVDDVCARRRPYHRQRSPDNVVWPVEDCYADLLWLHAAAEEIHVDAERIMIAGESAGAGLVAALCQLARDRGNVKLLFQYLAEPMLDHHSVDSDHPHVGHFGWTRDHKRFGWSSMLEGESRQPVSPYCAPATADGLSGLPLTFIHIGAIELFLEEPLDYARRLTRAGVGVELHVWPGAFYAFQSNDCQISREARHVARTAIYCALHGDVK